MKRRIQWLLLLCAFLFILWLTAHWSRENALDELQQQAGQELIRYFDHLQGQLEKYEFLPMVLASNKRLITLLQHPGDPERIETLNRYLETINRITGTSDTYLMDAEGLTIAASNWQSERPFVGRNFSYRPYFQEAMKGNLGRYFALGTTSNKRGYYFAYPVRHDNRILGAVVIKIGIDPVERRWGRSDAEFLVTDPDGVVFITTRREWRFKTLEPLPDEVFQRIRESRRYADAPLTPLPVVDNRELAGGARILSIGGARSVTYLLQALEMPQAGWRVHILSRLDKVDAQVMRNLVFVSLLLAAMTLLVLFWLQRRKRLRERERYQHQNKRLLEQRVEEQTRDLTAANIRLTREIEQHRRTAIELQQAQDALIQSAKLAVIGQLSTGISHELNQPLAAIRSYADNARALLGQERWEDVTWNLRQISELTERMAQISTQLKIFARKTSGQQVAVSLSAVLDDSLELFVARIRETGTEIRRESQRDLQVLANRVQLEQVLVNLIGNALHAVEAVEKRFIEFHVAIEADRVRLTMRDSGPGIDLDILNRIFDPFFTTKEEGRGLGLGLSISQRIVEVMEGELNADNHPDGGARFTLYLQQVTD